jgi:hypothetical protein
MPTCHAEVTPIKAYVQETFLYDMDPAKTGLITCYIFGVSSYPGYALTFTIWIPETGGTFAFVPLHALQGTKTAIPVPLALSDLTTRNAPDPEIAVCTYEFLKERPLQVFFKGKDLRMSVTYLFSVDWYKENELVNVILLENGQFAALPNHRVLFGVKRDKLPDYKKMHGEWRV